MCFWNILPHFESAPRYAFKLHHTKKKKKKVVKNEIQDQKKHKAMVSFDFQMSPLVWWRKKEMWTKIYIKRKFYKLW